MASSPVNGGREYVGPVPVASSGSKAPKAKGGGAGKRAPAVSSRSLSSKVEVHAAGGIIWRRNKRRLEVVLIHRPRYDDWSFPKGKLKQGEDLRTCAIREVSEESRIPVVLRRPAGSIRYRLPGGQLKEVTYWTCQEVPKDHPSLKARPVFARRPRTRSTRCCGFRCRRPWLCSPRNWTVRFSAVWWICGPMASWTPSR